VILLITSDAYPAETEKSYTLGESNGSLSLRIRRNRVGGTDEVPIEQLSCQFIASRNGEPVAFQTHEVGRGFERRTKIYVDRYLNNGRKQVLVGLIYGAATIEMLDWDGINATVVYRPIFGTRQDVEPIRIDGRWFVHETFGNPVNQFGDAPLGFAMFKGGEVERLLTWNGSFFVPVRFRYVHGRIAPIVKDGHLLMEERVVPAK